MRMLVVSEAFQTDQNNAMSNQLTDFGGGVGYFGGENGSFVMRKGIYNRVHRVAMAIFLRTFHHEGKISPAWLGWWCTARHPPLALYLLSRTKLWCTLQLSVQNTLPLFLLCPLCTLWLVTEILDSLILPPHKSTIS
jgi:hypothetical protein